jgi:hypothetical protein
MTSKSLIIDRAIFTSGHPHSISAHQKRIPMAIGQLLPLIALTAYIKAHTFKPVKRVKKSFGVVSGFLNIRI